ncbi:uncharacterized protein TNCV_1619661, partial [Trichonephila clavipes]
SSYAKGSSLSLGDNKPFAVRSDLGWIVAGNVPSEEMFSSIAVNSIQEAYYLPHHAVLRDSSTTKLRVVFDASAKSTSGYSLNDILMVGPRVQRDVYPILLSFRTFQIAVCADLEKMFRQIRISSEDTNWQRILWRDNPKETVKEYRLTTVTYMGHHVHLYLSTRTLTQLAFDERERYPLASFATLHHFYVDDLPSGAATEKKQLKLVWQLKEMMKKEGSTFESGSLTEK